VESNKRILIGTIGYHNLTNHSIGPALLDKIRQQSWAENVTIEEMNWGPIAIVQWFQTLEDPFDRVILFTAIHRHSRPTGEVTVFKWGGKTPDEKDVQARVGDAVTGVISAENLLIIGEYFNIWPNEVFIVDVEPGPEMAGPVLTEALSARESEYLQVLENLSVKTRQNEENFTILYGDQI
jgi:hypothetical protein